MALDPSNSHALQRIGILLLAVIAFFAGLARRLNIPYPILLVLAGLCLSFIPHVPRIPLSPDIVFFVFLPPLLYAAAWQTDSRGFRRNLLSIGMLATGLVAFTVLGIAFFADHFITALDFRSGFLLGAVVAATDAVAATSIARSLGLPPTITSILEGESLLNDATALLALELGLSMLLEGRPPSVHSALLHLLRLITGGIGLGLAVGWLFYFCERWIEDGPLEMVVSIIVPYVAYLIGEELHASGVICVVTSGLFLSRRSAKFLTPPARIQIFASWQALDFVLNGLVFLLIGLQLPYILPGIHEYGIRTLALDGFLFSIVLIGLRLLWVFPGAAVSVFFRRKVLHQQVPAPTARGIFVIGWTGMRGVVSLAAALSLPYTLSNGQPFAQRNIILFLTFSIILVTLVLQGLTLPPLIRALGLTGSQEEEHEELTARRILLRHALLSLQKQLSICSEEDRHDLDDLIHLYEDRLETIRDPSSTPATTSSLSHARRARLQLEALNVERSTLLDLRDRGLVSDDVLRQLEHELDLSETGHIVRS
ncbi:MAG TPA: Na+/H+ antiporter [Bryocella sp.]|nr:Na+/H+ antiporter [Bryocella sp.]